ncbi:hypothetical protein STRCI_008593 [Streptomyces cinnabarinus]|uniref:Uncharacterized protein n=1 Tax=Streptomyces cinnabarinus TaxID=67287 RepID=A0ABY7KVA8_9ACTN|nr:hypothetical protein [Streptomyces cinnabarinus]WAZ26916.1 hypothetical protein STRCI_008593 [Streptomyces cinnabarinus]
MLLAPVLEEHLSRRFNARARERVRTVEGDGAVRDLHRLAAVHTFRVPAAAGGERCELRRSAETGHSVLRDASCDLHTHDTRSAVAGSRSNSPTGSNRSSNAPPARKAPPQRTPPASPNTRRAPAQRHLAPHTTHH